MPLKFVIITPEEPFYLPGVIARIAEERPSDILAIAILQPFSPKSGWTETIRRQLMLLGPIGFLRQSLRFVLYKLRDRMGTRGRRFYSVAAVARKHGIEVLHPPNINAESFLAKLREMNPDVIASISASQIFRKELLKLPRLGCINVHSAPLPRYRGMLPSFWVLANGETETAVTVHHMDEKLDNGDIIVQRGVTIDPGETQHTLLMKTKAAGAEALLDALRQLESGSAPRMPNRAEDATYFSFPTSEDVRRFRAAGKRFF